MQLLCLLLLLLLLLMFPYSHVSILHTPGERSVFCFKESGSLRFMKKLDFNPSCMHAYGIIAPQGGELVYLIGRSHCISCSVLLVCLSQRYLVHPIPTHFPPPCFVVFLSLSLSLSLCDHGGVCVCVCARVCGTARQYTRTWHTWRLSTS